MKKAHFFAVLTALIGIPAVATAATYPVYNNNTTTSAYQNYNAAKYNQATNQINTTMVSNPTRYTGSLPRVGNSSSNAGRQYYQPATYDRLADSGLYIGLSLGYSMSVSGGMSADYSSETNAFWVPGAFQESTFKTDSVTPIQVSVGAAINDDVRVDFSYLRYNGIEYNDTVMTSDGAGGFSKAKATGGAITSSATMLNLYYNIDSYTGFLAGGNLKPYVGIGVGLSLNTIADYVVADGPYYYYAESELSSVSEGTITGIENILAYHNGGTVENMAYMLELGLTTEMDGGMKLDFFVRYAGLGSIQTSGSVVLSQTELYSDGTGGEYPIDTVFHYTNYFESGELSSVDIGARMRLQF